MPSTATTRNRLNKQATGDNVDTWGVVLNQQVFDLIDEALDGLTTVTVTGNTTLISTNYVSDQARKRMLRLTGSPGVNYTITVPSVEKFYLVHNQTNASQTIKAGGTGVSVSSGSLALVYCDAVDCFTPTAAATPVIVDRAYSEYTSNASITSTIPNDDTIPQVSEGTQILSAAITPKSSSNRLRAVFVGQADTASGDAVIAALFVNGAANAVRAVLLDAGEGQITLVHEFSPGSTSTQTLTIRVGTESGDTLRFNGYSNARRLGGVSAATLVVEEITA